MAPYARNTIRSRSAGQQKVDLRNEVVSSFGLRELQFELKKWLPGRLPSPSRSFVPCELRGSSRRPQNGSATAACIFLDHFLYPTSGNETDPSILEQW